MPSGLPLMWDKKWPGGVERGPAKGLTLGRYYYINCGYYVLLLLGTGACARNYLLATVSSLFTSFTPSTADAAWMALVPMSVLATWPVSVTTPWAVVTPTPL